MHWNKHYYYFANYVTYKTSADVLKSHNYYRCEMAGPLPVRSQGEREASTSTSISKQHSPYTGIHNYDYTI